MAQVMERIETAPVLDAPVARSRAAGFLLTGGTGLGTLLVFLLVKGSLTDDAYITLAYAKNVATDLHWGLIPQETANSATSPLNILLLAAVTAATGIFGAVQPVLALGVVTVGLSMVMGWGWTRLMRVLRLPAAAAVLGLALVLVNPLLLSAVGLEVVLIPTVLVLLVAMATEGRPVWFGVICGLAVLTRLDLIVFVLIIALCTATIRRRLHWAVLGAVVTAGPWYVFSWFVRGSAIPDTLVIKTMQPGLFGEWSFMTGPMMLFLSRSVVIALAFGPALLGVIAVAGWLSLRSALRWEQSSLVRQLTPAAALGIGGIAYYIVYSLMEVGPYHWYYVAPIVALSIFLALALGAWMALSKEMPALRTRAPAVALSLVALLGIGSVAVDVKQGVPWKSPPIFGNWASAQDYARVAEEIGQRVGGKTVASPGEIGTLAYFCNCAIVDEFSDRGRVLDKINRRIDTSGAITSLALRINYYWLDRTTPPRPLDYRLEYAAGAATGPDSWTVYSAAKGIGHFTLIEAN